MGLGSETRHPARLWWWLGMPIVTHSIATTSCCHSAFSTIATTAFTCPDHSLNTVQHCCSAAQGLCIMANAGKHRVVGWSASVRDFSALSPAAEWMPSCVICGPRCRGRGWCWWLCFRAASASAAAAASTTRGPTTTPRCAHCFPCRHDCFPSFSSSYWHRCIRSIRYLERACSPVTGSVTTHGSLLPVCCQAAPRLRPRNMNEASP